MGKVYDNSGKCVGRVELSNGVYKVYDSEYETHCIGRIESDGKVYYDDSGSGYGGYCDGLIKGDKVYNESGERCRGYVNSEGKIYNTENYNESAYVGSADSVVDGAAGLILLELKVEPVESVTSGNDDNTPKFSSTWDWFWNGLVMPVIFALLVSYFKAPFVEFADINEASNRKKWWWTCILSVISSFIALFVIVLVSSIFSAEDSIVVGVFVIICLIYGILPIIAVSIRRMHDIGKSGWWVLAPLVNFVMCGFLPGKIDGNKYI